MFDKNTCKTTGFSRQEGLFEIIVIMEHGNKPIAAMTLPFLVRISEK